MNKKYRILYVEDDETLAFLTKDNLELNHFDVTHFYNGEGVIESFSYNTYDVCVLDIMLPKKDGFELATAIRKMDNEIPIIFLSAKTLKEDRIKGLKLGADDYLIKPFSIEELVLKIEIFLKRRKKSSVQQQYYTAGKFMFDVLNYELVYNGEKISLTQRETDLLKLFVENPGRVLKREEILKQLWGDDDYFMGRSLDVFISRLRKILSKDPSITIENLHRIGFKYFERK
ncbi:response regulator transcription factor [Ferruginibacter albus]|uniref:response regulator transcription factor n=1 Tax=Ferruginibacter albus TaxID=2875540 RepID=UPI001CC56B29|nr:response regulator transcription factor [Ferruginibacter albus]UAY53541.1 response regulator transcription factor [Ferruginibacter albus]